VAAVAAGEQPAAVARRFGISQGRLHDWCRVDGPAGNFPKLSGSAHDRTRERMAELIYDSLVDALSTIRLQLQAVAREEWLAKQSAAELAALLDKEFDGTIRLLAGFRPAEPVEPEQPDAIDGEYVERGRDLSPRLGDGERDDRPAD
jgi:hypothetical protein